LFIKELFSEIFKKLMLPKELPPPPQQGCTHKQNTTTPRGNILDILHEFKHFEKIIMRRTGKEYENYTVRT
jgi:hypothetical protein